MADDNPVTGSVQCEFCDCRISRASGEMVARSKKATAMMKLDDEAADLREQIKAHEATIAKLRTDLETAEAKAKQVPVGAGASSGDDDDEW